MRFVLTTLPEDHNWACCICMNLCVKGDRRADWECSYTANGGSTERICDAHLPTYAGNLVVFRDVMATI